MPNNAFPYPGNKARHAEWILQHIPEHECYVEPFGGAAGVLFNKPRSKVEVYNDIDGDIVHFFEVLRDRPEELQSWLERVPYARQLHEEWATAYYEDGYRPDDDIERAGRWFFLRYSQFASRIATKDAFVAVTSWNPASSFKNKTEVICEFASRLRDVSIESNDYRDVLKRYDSSQTVFYIDPPYQGTESMYGTGGFNHRVLHDTLADCEADVLVSYDDIPPYYGDGWQIATKSSHMQMGNTSGDGMKDATEVLLMNFDADGQPLMSDVGQQTIESF